MDCAPDSDTALALHPRTLVVAGDNSQATVIETFAGADGTGYWTNAVTEIRLGRNASVQHLKRQSESTTAYHTALTQVRLDRDARFSSVALAVGGLLSRNEVKVAFEGEGATCKLSGGALLRGRQHADSTTEADHRVPHTNSDQVFRNVLDDNAHSVFQGGVIVRQDAQKTDSSQSNRNLLLSAGAQAGAGDLRGRCQMRPWRNGRRPGRGGHVLPRKPRYSAEAGKSVADRSVYRRNP